MFIRRSGAGRLALCVSVLVGLAACSHSPSDSDAKAAIKARLRDCKYFSVKNFDKLNGIPVDGNDYRVEVKYSIMMDLDSRYHDRLKEHLKNVDGFNAMKADFEARLDKFKYEMVAYVAQECPAMNPGASSPISSTRRRRCRTTPTM